MSPYECFGVRTFEIRIQEDLLDLLVLAVDLERREANTLLPRVARVAERGGDHPADVGHVGDVHGVGQDLAVPEVRLDDAELGGGGSRPGTGRW